MEIDIKDEINYVIDSLVCFREMDEYEDRKSFFMNCVRYDLWELRRILEKYFEGDLEVNTQ